MVEIDKNLNFANGEIMVPEPQITPQARFIVKLLFANKPTPIPDEYRDESIVLISSLLQALTPLQRKTISLRVGFANKAQTYSEIGQNFHTTGNAVQINEQAAYKNVRLIALKKGIYQNLWELGPVYDKSIARRIVGNITNRQLHEQLPNAPFDYSKLSEKARFELWSFGQTRTFATLTLAQLGSYTDPGLSDETVQELKQEAVKQSNLIP